MTNLTPIQKAARYAGGQATLARGIGMSPSMMNQVYKGARPLPAQYCVAIEKQTNGQIKRTQLIDNWEQYWPEFNK